VLVVVVLVAGFDGWMGGGKAAEAMAANWVEKVVRMSVQMYWLRRWGC